MPENIIMHDAGSQNLLISLPLFSVAVCAPNRSHTILFILCYEMNPVSNGTDAFYCETNADCFEHGICSDLKCLCYPLWTGQQCETNKVDSSPVIFRFFWAQNAICSALFLAVAVAAVVQLAMLDERRRKLKKNNYATWTLYSVIAFIGFERILYLMLDPYRYRGIIGAIAESILFGLATWGLVCLYLMILIMWIKMYRATRNSEALVSKFVKYIWGLMGLVLVVQVVYDVIRAIYAAGQGRTVALIVYFAIAISCSVFISVVFLVYGRLLYRRLIKFKDQDPTRQKKINKVTRFTTTASIVVISYSLALLVLIIVTLIYGEDVLVFLISHFLERLIEVGACTAILITHHVNIRQHRIQISTAGGSSTNNSTVRSRSMSALRASSIPVIEQPTEKDEEASAGEHSSVV